MSRMKVFGFSVIRLIDEPGRIESGEILFVGRDLMKLSEQEMNRVRGKDISMVSITGQFTTEEAHDLAVVLRAGSLPAPVNILEERTVGPSLGQESIDKGFMAACIGGVMVVLFMILYYRRAGVIAALCVLLYLCILCGFDEFKKSVLTRHYLSSKLYTVISTLSR